MATPPAAPDPPLITILSTSSVRLVWGGDNATNGAAIDDRDFWGSDTATPETAHDGDAPLIWTGLTPGKTYYFWARAHNSAGWSGYSSRVTVKMPTVPAAPGAPVASLITQTEMTTKFTPNSDGGSPITEYDLAYGTSSLNPQTVIFSDGSDRLQGLLPATTYYLRARAYNKYGAGPWSSIKSARTLAGAWVKQGGVWRQAVPYVRVNGVWKVARPWTKIAGVWKEDS